MTTLEATFGTIALIFIVLVLVFGGWIWYCQAQQARYERMRKRQDPADECKDYET